MDTINIPLGKGGELEVSITDEFLLTVRSAMSVPPETEVSNADIVNFIHTAFKVAIDKESIGDLFRARTD